jgi:hypothetical protein
MDDERSPIEENGGNFVWRWSELLTCEDAVEDKAFVWQRTGLDRQSYSCQHLYIKNRRPLELTRN